MIGAIFSETTPAISQNKKSSTKPLAILFLGPPGAGKGTHALPLSQFLKIPHISTGDLFREQIRQKTSLGLQAKSFMDLGKLVPDALVFDILFLRIEQEDCQRGFILDGFPRTLPQGEALHLKLHTTHQIIALNFSIADSHLVERVTGRIVCKNCGAPYHTINHPPKVAATCDFCQNTLCKRDDDLEEILRKRLEVYRIQTEPLIAFYKKQANLFQQIAAERSQSEVFSQILHSFK